MSIQGPLLTVQQGSEGTFVRWLEDLGLKVFLQRYPASKLVEWGWLVPQYRYVFPPAEFEDEAEYSIATWPPTPTDDPLQQLWESEWLIKSSDEPFWFIHPFFRLNNDAGKMLRNDAQPWGAIPIPSAFTNADGRTIIPYVDYFFHWQGYALIDVIRASDCIEPILNTPNVKEHAQGIVRIAERLEHQDPRGYLEAPLRWGGLSKPMTWIAHYRAFCEALPLDRTERLTNFEIKQRGCRELAAHLDITAEKLSAVIENDLLGLADHWLSARGRRDLWAAPAWASLQQDIYLAVEWLCYLSDKKLDDYLEKWSRPAHRQYDGTAELTKVLPFQFFNDRYCFLDIAPHYLKLFNESFNEEEKLVDDRLRQVVDKLRAENYPFGGFLKSFSQLHDELTIKSTEFKKLDFRDRRPLDFYSMLAIRAEGCLMFALRESGELNKIASEKRDLNRYISYLAEKRKLSKHAIQFFCSKEAKKLVLLHSEPEAPIRAIMSVTLPLPILPREQQLVRAFLCCVLARNYFAHHHYLDRELLRGDESAFMLGGIIVTVLFLLE